MAGCPPARVNKSSESRPMREQQVPEGEEQDGYRFGNYDIIRPIDVGGMGEVYLARQRTAFGRYVAIKIIRSDLMHDLIARARFLREAEVSAHLKHEHILQLLEFGEEQGRLFLATPYIQGGTLAQRLENGPLTLPEVHTLFTALVQAVAYIHRRGVIHRDLKPSNILLDSEDGQIYVRLIDFGIATLMGRPASPPLTKAGNELGTIAYMAPERLSGIAAPSNDIYSLGIILYEMWTGHLPSADQPVKLPQALQNVVHRCIALRLEDRFASADELLQAFEQAYQSLSTSPKGSSSIAPIPSMRAPSEIPAAPHLTAPRVATPTLVEPEPEAASLLLSEEIPSPPLHTQPSNTFKQEDYNAPTMYIGPSSVPVKQATGGTPSTTTGPRAPKKRGRPLLAMTSIMIVLVLLVIAGLLFYEIPAASASSATINFSPKTQLISKVFTITAQPSSSAQAVNVAAASIPAKVITSSKTGSLTVPTTGQQCDFFFNCQQTVSASDISNAAAQLRPNLVSQVSSDLQGQLQASNAHAVSKAYISDHSEIFNPSVGSVSKTVTVTLTEQGGVEYILNSDAQNLAHQLLSQEVQKLGPNYVLMSSTIKIGSPVIEAIDSSTGRVTIKIAAGGVAKYHFPPAELQAMQSHLKNMTLKNARSYIMKQDGVDPGTIGIHFTVGGGNTLPSNPQDIKIVTVDPNTLPDVQLSVV